jgi:hypothetical protein
MRGAKLFTASKCSASRMRVRMRVRVRVAIMHDLGHVTHVSFCMSRP